LEDELSSCLDTAGATAEQKSSCESCIATVAKLAGAIDDNTSATCEEVDQLACAGLETNCDCLTCEDEKIALGQCSIDEERAENGMTECGPVTCGPTPAPAPVPAPTPSSSAFATATATGGTAGLTMMTLLLLAME
jgi:hypothetical protein